MTNSEIDFDGARVYAIPMRARFRGITVREGMLPSFKPRKGLPMDDPHKHEQDIAIAYQSRMGDGSRLDENMEDAAVTRLGIERGEQWATAALADGPYPERL